MKPPVSRGVGVRLQRDRPRRRDLHAADIVDLQDPGGHGVAVRHVQPVAHIGHGRRNLQRSAAQGVRTAVGQLLVAHPHDVGGIPVGKLWWLPGDQQVRTRDVDVFVEFDSDGLTGDRLLELGRLGAVEPVQFDDGGPAVRTA